MSRHIGRNKHRLKVKHFNRLPRLTLERAKDIVENEGIDGLKKLISSQVRYAVNPETQVYISEQLKKLQETK